MTGTEMEMMELLNSSMAQGFNMGTGRNCSPPHTSPNGIRQAVLVVYSAGFLFGAAGNALVIGIISYYKHIRIKSVANYYIWNLSLADLLFILTLPFSIYASYTQDWPFGGVTCKISYAFRETNRFSSVFLLVALSWDRFIASFYNLSHLRTIRFGGVICVVIWVICATLSTPYWLFAQTKLSRNNQTMCVFHWPSRLEYMKLWTFFQLTIGLLLPLIMITLAYILLSARLKKMISGVSTSSVKKPSRKMTKTVAVVVTTFLVCQTPYYMMGVWSFLQQQKGYKHRLRGDCFVPSRLEVESLYYLNAIAEILVFISSSINPILYGLMNDNYRELYRVVLCRCQSRSPAASKAVTVPVQERAAGTGAGSGSESESQGAAVAEVTYRFQENKIKFNCPCTKAQTGCNHGAEHIAMKDVQTSPVTL